MRDQPSAPGQKTPRPDRKTPRTQRTTPRPERTTPRPERITPPAQTARRAGTPARGQRALPAQRQEGSAQETEARRAARRARTPARGQRAAIPAQKQEEVEQEAAARRAARRARTPARGQRAAGPAQRQEGADKEAVKPRHSATPLHLKTANLSGQAQALVRTCEDEIERATEPQRIAKLHVEIAQVCEDLLGDPASALAHYNEALEVSPESLPALRGVRRLAMAAGDCERAVSLLDAEARVTADAKATAMLFFEKGRLLEDFLGRAQDAATAYAHALDLDSGNLSVLKAANRLAADKSDSEELASSYERAANAVTNDPQLRAAFLLQRAEIAERSFGDSASAVNFYESALRLDPRALGAIDALKRLYHKNRDWSHLVTVLEREAEQTSDERIRAISLHHAGRLLVDRLGNRSDALRALARAAKATGNRDRLVLEDLARLYEGSEKYEALTRALEVLAEIVTEPAEKVEILHRIGHVLESRLDDEETAIRAYQAALAIDATHVPTLRALGALLARRGEFVQLVEMLLQEAEAVDDTRRRAQAHARVGEILDAKLHRPSDAIDHYARALSLTPDNVASFRALTRLYAQSGRFRELVELYERALDQTQNRSRRIAYLFKIGSIHEDSLADPANAAYAYRRVLELDSKNLVAVHALQRMAEQAGRWDELVAALELEAEESEDDELVAALLHRAGTVLDEQLGQREAAIDRFRKVLDSHPEYVPALSSLGRLYYRAGRWEDLLDIYQREMTAQPDRPDAVVVFYKMGELCETRLGRDEDAIEYYRQAAQRDPSYRPALSALARKLRERDAWAELVDVFELELQGINDPRAKAFTLWNAGAVYEERLERPDKAIACYERARLASPDYWPATLELTRLRNEEASWSDLVDDLERVGEDFDDEVVTGAALLRQGAIWRDHLGDRERATQCFETLAGYDSGKLPALLALESLYSDAESWAALANAYAVESDSVADPAARAASLRALARVQEVKSIGSIEDLVATYEAILGVLPDDENALLALERIAGERKNRDALAMVYRKLGKASDDPGLSARYLTSMGHAREISGDPNAIAAYRTALEEDAECLAAIRGLARTAQALGDARSLSEAWRREAKVVRDARTAADLLVKSAVVRLEELEAADTAMRDLERALEIWPDGQNAAERLCEPLLAAGRVDYLIDVLSRAAGSARSPEATAEHWLRVSDIRFEKQGDLAAALTALERALAAAPDHLAAVRRLGDLYRYDHRYRDAVGAYERAIELATDDAQRWRLHLELAEIFREHLGDAVRARACLTTAIDLGDADDPNYPLALASLAEIQLKLGDADAAVSTARRMVETADDDDSQASALVFWAEIEAQRGELDRSERALAKAVALSGAEGEAGRLLRDLIAKHKRSWAGYAKGMTAYIQRLAAVQQNSGDPDQRDELIRAYIELARTHSDRMGLPRNAIANLEEGMATTGGDLTLAWELVPLLQNAGRFKDTVALLRELLASDVARPEIWRSLAQTLDDMKRPEYADIHLAPLIVLSAATENERARLRKRASGQAAAESFAIDTLRVLATERALSTAAAELLAAIADGVGKLYPPDFDRLGISRRDRVAARSRHPLRVMADQVAGIFGIEYELYVHSRDEPEVSVELTEPPAVVVAERVAQRPEAEQVFLLAYAMAPIAGRFYPADKLSASELEVLLVGATRSVVAGFGDDRSNVDELDQTAQRIRKAVPRRWRKAFEAAASSYSTSLTSDFSAWQRSLDITAMRAALLLADDLGASVTVLTEAEDLAGSPGPEVLASSPLIAGLVRFWASDKAVTVRRETGLLGGGKASEGTAES